MLLSDQESVTSYIGTSNSKISWDWSHETWSHRVSWEFSSHKGHFRENLNLAKPHERDWDPTLIYFFSRDTFYKKVHFKKCTSRQTFYNKSFKYLWTQILYKMVEHNLCHRSRWVSWKRSSSVSPVVDWPTSGAYLSGVAGLRPPAPPAGWIWCMLWQSTSITRWFVT